MTQSPALLAGRYRIRDPLGNGGMGRVWLARDEVLHRDVAIKEVDLPAGLSASEREELRTRTLREARTTARLSHPNVVQIYDVLGVEDRPWIVMEYVKSRSLQQILLDEGALPPTRVAEIGLAVLRALAAAHAAGVLHRDIKPGNVLIADDGRVVLTDFGLATFQGGKSSVTRPGLVWGSPEYVAPERAKHGVSSVEADLWSLGATLYAAVEGTSPYARSTAMASLTALATERPPAPAHAGPLKPVIAGLLRKDARARLRATEVERMLIRIADGESRVRPGRVLPRQRGPEDATGPADRTRYALPEPPPSDARETSSASPEPPEKVWPGPSRRAWLLVTAVVVALGLFATTVVLLATDNRPDGSAATKGPAASATSVPTVITPGSPPPSPGLAPPVGWTYYQERGRFRMFAPLGWEIQHHGTVTSLHEPTGPKVITVDRWPAPPEGALAAARTRSDAWTAGTAGPPADYALVRLDPIGYFDQGLEWEYTHTDPANGATRTVSRWFIDTGYCYSISVSVPAYDFLGQTSYSAVVAGGFKPSRLA
jgi:eukaryotic-like serine/threonine-protein kinase